MTQRPRATGRSHGASDRATSTPPRTPSIPCDHSLTQGSPERLACSRGARVYAYHAGRPTRLATAPAAAAAATAASTACPVSAPVTRMMFHDDGYSISSACTDITALRRPLAGGGAPFAAAKARATGPLADQLVACLWAATVDDDLAIIIGIPVGTCPQRWLRSVFMPKFHARSAALLDVATTAGKRHLAAVAANLSRGPDAMARHWMRVTLRRPTLFARDPRRR